MSLSLIFFYELLELVQQICEKQFQEQFLLLPFWDRGRLLMLTDTTAHRNFDEHSLFIAKSPITKKRVF